MQSRPVQFVAALILIACTTFTCFRSLIRHPSDILVGPQRLGWNDLTTYFIPMHDHSSQCLRHLQAPWWNSLRGGGTPHLGNPQSALFYPPNWLCWVWDPAHVLSWLLVLHHVLAGAGAYALSRRFGSGWLPSTLAGSVFAAAPYLVAQSGEGHYAQICSIAWMPWALLACDSLGSGSFRAMSVLAGILAISFFAGHPQELYYVLVILTARMGLDALDAYRCRGLSGAIRHLGTYALVLAMAFAMVAVDLFPILTYVRESSRAQPLSEAEAGAIGMNLANLFQLFDPFALGGPETYGGRDKFYWETLCSFGIPTLILALLGAVAGWRHRNIQFMVGAGLVAFLFGFGTGSPLFWVLFHVVPGATQFRVPSRVLFFCSLVIALLAASGADAVIQLARSGPSNSARWLRRALIAVCLGSLAALLVIIVWKPADPVTADTKGSARSAVANESPKPVSGELGPLIILRAVRRAFGRSQLYGWLLLTSAPLLLALRWPRWAVPALASVYVLASVQLAVCAGKLLTILPFGEFRRSGAVAEFMSREATGDRVLTPMEFLPDHVAQSLGIAKLQAYDPLPLARRTEFFRLLTGRSDPTSVEIGGSSPDLDTIQVIPLDLADVRFVVQNRIRTIDLPERSGWVERARGDTEPFHIKGPATRRSEFVIFENENALPRAYVVGQTKVLAKGSDLATVMAELRPRQEALLEAEFLPPGPRANFAPARILEYTASQVVVEANLPAVGYLVLCDSWYPGWTALDNGRPTSVIPANLMFRAVPLSAGKHEVVFQYKPVGLATGALLSTAAWVGILLLFFSGPFLSTSSPLPRLAASRQ